MTQRTSGRGGLSAALIAGAVVTALIGVAASAADNGRRDDKKNEGWRIIERQKWFEESRGLRDQGLNARKLREEGVQVMRLRAADSRLKALSSGEVWQEMGPSTMNMTGWAFGKVSGRNNAIVVHPSDENTIYFGAAAGGVWKTTNGGSSWTPVFDQVGTLPIGAVHLDPANPQRVWVGTGDKNGGGCAGYLGNGVFLSTDGGTSWTAKNGSGSSAMPMNIVNSVVVSPTNGNVVLAGGFGSCDSSGVLSGSGIYRSTDGGNSWTKIYNGAVEDMIFMADGNTVLASAPGTGVIKSTNGGASFASASSGMTAGNSRIRLAQAPSAPNTFYTLHDNGRLYRSTNAGGSWTQMNASACEGQCTYNLTIAVNPTNPDRILVGSIRHAISTNGGSSLSYQTSQWGTGQKVHQDTHVLTWSRSNSNRFWVGTDGGIWRSDDGGSNYANVNSNLNVTQFYDIAVDFNDENKIFGGAQDNSSSGRTAASGKIWNLTYASGDGFMNAIDPSNPNVVLQTSYPNGGYPWIVRSTTGGAGNSFNQLPNTGLTSSNNFPWVTPLATAGNKAWVASDRVYVATTAASSFSWSALSGTLGSAASVLTPVQIGSATTLMVGTSSGKIFRSTNPTVAGGTLSDVTGNYPGGRVSDIAVDPTNASRVFVTRGNFGGARLYRSTSGGSTWTAVGSGLPNVPANAVAIDPKNLARVFVGTDVGMYVSTNNGDSFEPFNTGMPLGMVVTDLEVDDAPHILVAGTYGRGAWKMNLQSGGGNLAPVAGFNTATSGLTATFTDTSSDTDGSIASRVWAFGDGTTSTATNPVKTYSAAGTYNVKLTVTDNQGATDELTKPVTVSAANQPPVASFNFSASGLTVTFTDASTDADGSIASRAWTFGDGSTSSAQNPVKTYSAAGSYTVGLTVTDNQGATHSTTRTVTVAAANQPPVANFNFSANNLQVAFTDLSTDADGSIVSRQWNFGDGTSSTAQNPSKTYASPGSYNVSLTVTDDKGASNSFSRVVEVSDQPVNVPPAANFSFTVSGLTANFTDSSTDSDGSITARSWKFGDGSTSTAQNPAKTYSAAGTYNVELTVTDNRGATNLISKPVTVTASACSGSTVTGVMSGYQGETQVQPGGSWYQSTRAGAHKACFTGPAGTDFDLYLDKWNGASWTQVAVSEGPTSVENINYNGTAGYYRYRVVVYSGSGSYTLIYSRP